MRRAAAILSFATLVLLAVPATASAQEPVEHTVSAGNTLWDLAERFYGDPFQWRTIWEANLETIPNPDLIFPGQVIRIPDGQGGFLEVRVVPEGTETVDPREPPADPAPELPQERPGIERTIFYPDTTSVAGQFFREVEARLVMVPRQVVLGAPFLTDRADFEAVGELTGFSADYALRSNQTTAQPFNRMEARTTRSLPVGSHWVSIRRELRPDLGEVAIPTGLFTVLASEEEGARLILDVALDRVMVGNELIAALEYAPEPGVRPQAEEGGPTARVLGYALDAALHGPGDHLFLDQGEASGVHVGDEFTVVFGGQMTEAVAQVVRVDSNTASARILRMRSAVFLDGAELVRSRRMPATR